VLREAMIRPVRALVLVLALSLPALAGCITPPEDPVGTANATARNLTSILPYMDLSEAHNHSDPADHRSSWNFETLGHSFLADDPTKLGRYNQVAYRDGYAYVSAYRVPPTQQPGMIVVDVKDPAAPKVVGTYTTSYTTPIDVVLSEDGKYAFLAGHRNSASNVIPQGCTGTQLGNVCPPFVPAGVIALDITDPTNPREVATYSSAPAGAHTVKYATIGGEGYVFIASYGLMQFRRIAPSVEIARFDGKSMEFVSRYFITDYLADPNSFVHDMWVEPEHAILGKPLMYVAHWDAGVRIVDLSDIKNPREMAAWTEFDAATYGNIHFVRPAPTLIGGKHITVAAPEYGSAEHAGMMWVLDTTDPTKPELLGTWVMPGDPVSEGNYRYSPHNFEILPDGRLVYGHYHGGVWILDIGTNETLAAPKVLGFTFPVPAEGEITDAMTFHEDAPNVWNAVWANPDEGLIVASDIQTGLYTLRFTMPEPGAVPPYEGLLEAEA